MRPSLRSPFWRRLTAAAGVCLFTIASSAYAQPTMIGGTRTGEGVKFSDVAFDEINNVYLQVFIQGKQYVYGRFVKADGAAVGAPFNVARNAREHSGGPHVIYSTGSDANVFLVVYSTDSGAYHLGINIWGQYIRFNGSGPEFLGDPFPVSDAWNAWGFNQNSGGLAFNPFTKQFLVTWDDSRPGWDIYARAFNLDRSPATPELNLTPGTPDRNQPSVAFDWRTRRYLVVWMGDMTMHARVYDESLQPLGGELLVTGGVEMDCPDVVYLPEASEFLLFWREDDRTTSANIVGVRINANGAKTTGIYPLLVTPWFDGTPDADYSWSSRTVFVTAMHDSGYVWGAELNATGQPMVQFKASNVQPARDGLGAMHPQVIAGLNGQFGVRYSMNYVDTWLDRWQSAVASQPGPRPNAPQPAPPVTIDLSPTAAPNGSWMLAEGAANTSATGYRTYYLIANPNQRPVTVRAYFSSENGVAVKKEFTVAAESRYTLDLLGAAGPGSFGSVFQSLDAGYDVRVERSIYWGPNMEGSTGEVATKSLSPSWIFAEGSRGGERFANYFLLFNPTQTAATAQPTFYFDDKTSFTPPPVTVGPQQRVTIDANSYPQLANRDFATYIGASSGIIAERAMYWGWGGANLWLGGTASMGSTRTSPQWYFAEGAASAGFWTYYLLWNTTNQDIWVHALFMTEHNGLVSKTYKIPALSRRTVELNSEVGGAVGGVAAAFWSDNADAFVAERSSYWGMRGWIEGVNVFGSPAAAGEWILPEGTTGGLFSTYLLLLNPTADTVQVDVSIYLEQGQGKFTPPNHLTLAPHSRTTIDMAGFLHDVGAPQGSFATRVKVAGAGSVVAEHAIYWRPEPGNFWRAGSAAAGIPR